VAFHHSLMACPSYNKNPPYAMHRGE